LGCVERLSKTTKKIVWEGYRHYVLVDGKQRIEAVRRFLNNEIKAYGRFRYEFQSRIPSYIGFRTFIAELDDRASILQWYLGINSSGKPHSEAELSRVRQLLDAELEI
jgi:hypothetical protein